MLDDSYLYKKDFDQFYEKFKHQTLSDLYQGLYSNGRLLESDGGNAQDYREFLSNYNRSLQLINDLVKDNYELQHRVHQLGIKNRIRKKLGRYRPPEKINSYVSRTELENILNGSFVNKNYLPFVPFSKDALEEFKRLSNESFENGLKSIQKQITASVIKNPPLVSIVVLTRNGLDHLQRLFTNFDQLTGYPNYEIIVVDNASEDGTKEYLEGLKSSLNLQTIYNSENKSFSESNNIAAKKARGSYVLFLNNDVSPIENWLNHMVHTALKLPNSGAIGAKLVYPYKDGFENSYKLQHGGLGFRVEDGFIRPINMGVGEGFFSRNTSREEEKAGVTAACLLIEKTKFDEVDGFEEAYWYGYEDVDLCLKLVDKGYKNIINNAAVLFHYEFGTQSILNEKTVTNYRKKNVETFKNRWYGKLYPKVWESLLKQDGIYTDKRLHVAFVVTEASDKTAAGDYFTAKELGNALQVKGCKVSYIGVLDSADPYDIDENIDALISMIDNYDVSKVNTNKPVKIAWCRNWFDRWVERSYFRNFDIILSSSEIAQDLYKSEYLIDSHLFKIATNKARFTKKYSEEELNDYKSDICFTGNYWQVPRDISSLFDGNKIGSKYAVKIYGKDWDQVKELKPFWQGFLEYKDIPKVYAAGKILIDDAIFTTNKWGSVNSRVFDGAASGVLVLTNGAEGSKSTFDGLLPTYSTKEELSELLQKYLTNDELRVKTINEIRESVLNHHTYEHRASQFLEILEKELTKKIINIKLPIPKWDQAKQWGDFYFGQGLQRELEKHKFKVRLQILSDWDRPDYAFANIVLRGLSVFNTPKHQLNIMWNISHPEKVTLDEYKTYDYVFVASDRHTSYLKKKGLNNVHLLNQCFDKTIFNMSHVSNIEKYKSDILFVGNTRNEFRNIVKDVLSWEDIDLYDFKVYGRGWEKFIDKKYIADDFIENSKLKYCYQSAKIVLNDHWHDMNKFAFVSNRLFDASACGAFIISDSNPGIKEIFGPNVIEEYTNTSSLHTLLNKYISDPNARQARAKKAYLIVTKDHSFVKRVSQFISTVKEFAGI